MTATLNLTINRVERGIRGSQHYSQCYCTPDQAVEVSRRMAEYYEDNRAAGTALDVNCVEVKVPAKFATYLSKTTTDRFTLPDDVAEFSRNLGLVTAVDADYDGTRYCLTEVGRYVVGR